MKYHTAFVLSLAMFCGTVGCRAEVKTTEDSHRIEVEVPKVEIGDEPVDLDPDTDADVDIDTPAPGDK